MGYKTIIEKLFEKVTLAFAINICRKTKSASVTLELRYIEVCLRE